MFDRGSAIMQVRGAALLGMSIGNSHFSEANIRNLFGACEPVFSQLNVMITDVIGIHTLKAEGLSDVQATRKARLDGNALRNRIVRASEGLEDVHVINWQKEVAEAPAFQSGLENVRRLYTAVDSFRDDVRAATLAVIGEDGDIEEGVKYLLAELAFLDQSTTLLGVSEVAYVYHRDWPIFRRFAEGEYDGNPKPHLGFVIVK